MREFSPITLRDALYFVFKHKYKVISVTLAALALAMAFLAYVGPAYEAQLKILVMLGNEKTAALDVRPNSPNFMFAERGQNVMNEIQIIKDPSLTLAVMPKIKAFLDSLPKSEPTTFLQKLKAWLGQAAGWLRSMLQMPFRWLGLSVELTPEQQLSAALFDSLRYEFVEQTDVIRLSFWSADPNFAAFALNTYADEYIRRRIDVHEIVQSQDFYVEQIRVHREKLRDAEEALDRFQKEAGITVVEKQKHLLLEEQSRIDDELIATRLALADSRLKRDYIVRARAGADAWIETPDDVGASLDLNALDRFYFDLIAERARLRDTFSETSREIRSIDRQIGELRDRKADSLQDFYALRVEALAKKLAGYEREISDREAELRRLDSASIRLAELQRDVEVEEINLLTYLKKEEELRIADDLSEREITSVRIISRAVPPARPAAPRKGLLLAVAGFMGVFLGLAYAAVAQFLDHTFRDRRDVEEVIGAPLLLTLPELSRRRPRRRTS